MRKELRKLNNKRFTVTATFDRFGFKNGYKGPLKTILLVNVKKDEKLITDHLWFTCGKTFDQLELKPGDIISFDARVTEYEKGYKGHRAMKLGEYWSEIDYRLERPTKAKVIIRNDVIQSKP